LKNNAANFKLGLFFFSEIYKHFLKQLLAHQQNSTIEFCNFFLFQLQNFTINNVVTHTHCWFKYSYQVKCQS
jgi:hypothetical protein